LEFFGIFWNFLEFLYNFLKHGYFFTKFCHFFGKKLSVCWLPHSFFQKCYRKNRKDLVKRNDLVCNDLVVGTVIYLNYCTKKYDYELSFILPFCKICKNLEIPQVGEKYFFFMHSMAVLRNSMYNYFWCPE